MVSLAKQLRKLLILPIAALALAGCNTSDGTKVQQISPLIWHVEDGAGYPEKGLLNTCPTRGEAIRTYVRNQGDDSPYGLTVYCARIP